MPITIVQTAGTTNGNSGAGSTLQQSTAFGSAITAGNTVISFWGSESFATATTNGAVASVSDTNGNAYTIDGSAVNTTAHDYITIASVPNCLGGAANKITCNTVGRAFITFLGAIEVSNLATSSYLDGAGSSNIGAGGTTPSIASLTTSNANDLIVIAYTTGQQLGGTTLTPPTGAFGTFTKIAESHTGGTQEDGQSDYLIVTSTQGGITPAWTGGTVNQNWASLALAYKQISGSAFLAPRPLVINQSVVRSNYW